MKVQVSLIVLVDGIVCSAASNIAAVTGVEVRREVLGCFQLFLDMHCCRTLEFFLLLGDHVIF